MKEVASIFSLMVVLVVSRAPSLTDLQKRVSGDGVHRASCIGGECRVCIYTAVYGDVRRGVVGECGEVCGGVWGECGVGSGGCKH